MPDAVLDVLAFKLVRTTLRIVARVNDYDVRIGKVKGSYDSPGSRRHLIASDRDALNVAAISSSGAPYSGVCRRGCCSWTIRVSPTSTMHQERS